MDAPGPTINRTRLAQLLRKMINIYSPSGKEGDLIDYLEGYLKRHGLPVLRQRVEDKRYNLVVEPDEATPDLVFVGHVDTVEAFDLDQYGYQREGDTVWGLGAADMKGGCAAMIEAFVSLWENGEHDLPVALALVVGEEESGDGSRRLAREFQFSNAVIGEPTSLRPCLSHYGYLEIQLVTEGKRMHASMAREARRAVDGMLHLLLAYTRYLEQHRPEAVYNIRNLSSSDAGFAVPDRCEAWLDIHLPPRSKLGEITQEIEDVVKAEEALRPLTPSTSLNFHTIDAGYDLPVRGPLVDRLRQILEARGDPFEPMAFRSHSDANLLWNAGIRPIVLGPGQLEKAHTSEESASFAEVAEASEIYLALARASADADVVPE